MIRIGVLGPTTIDGDPVPGTRRRRLVAALVLGGQDGMPADDLVDAIWGEAGPNDPIAALQTLISRTRESLPPGITISTRAGGYRLEVEPTADEALDVARFDTLLDAGSCTDALALWRGRAYQDLETLDALAERARLEERWLSGREQEAEALLDRGHPVEAAVRMEALVVEHPLREKAVGLLMRARHASGRQSEALRAYRGLRDRLVEELGIDPSPELGALEGRILRQELIDEPAPAGDLSPPGRGGTVGDDPGAGLALPASSLVGRHGELAEVGRLLTEARLVTLTGPGGVGKTRLALHAAHRSALDHPDGVWMVELAEVEEGALVADAVATRLQVPREGDVAMADRIANRLAGRRALLVLDNCEHVIDEVAALVHIVLTRTIGVRVLATSRERLRVDGEHRFPVAPLVVDGEDATASELFEQRVAALAPGWAPSQEERAIVREICSRLDGLPLAIELAAAQVTSLTLQEIEDALDARFAVFDHGPRSAAPRHRSLEAVVGSSYDLLHDDDRSAFQAVCVFAGAFTRDDVEAVAGPDSARRLAGLSDRSLVVREVEEDKSWWRVLETLRAFGRDRAVDRGIWPELTDRHAQRAVEVVEAASAGLSGPEEAATHRALSRRLADLRMAQQHATASGDVDRALRMAHELHRWAWSRQLPEVGTWAERAFAAAVGSGHPLTASVGGAAAIAAWHRGDFDAARSLAEAGLDAGDPDSPGRHRCHSALGDLTLFEGDLDAAMSHYRQAVESAEGQRTADLVPALGDLALALGYADEVEEASTVLDRADELASSAGAPSLLAWAAYTRGEVVSRHDPAAAVPALVEALGQAEAVDAGFITGVAGLTWLTARDRAKGGPPGATLDGYRSLLERWWRDGAWAQIWPTLRNLAVTLEGLGHIEPAVALWRAQAGPDAAPAYGDDADRMEQLRIRLAGAWAGVEPVPEVPLDGPDAVQLALETLAAITGGASPRR